MCFLAVAVAAATGIELGLNLHIAGLVLRFRGSESLFFWLDNTAGNFGNYPLSVFPAVLQGAFTFGIPIAFAGYYPAAWLTGHAGTVPVSPVLVYLSPLVALLALLSGLAVWRRCLAWYSRNG
ncbi:ABC-2 family transporter protein [Streptomyces sp. NPDC087226]|uniref:ABC-2 family transporter protein n=1 Tax=Streptomyces sp. NPDC087226 TaxID=3365771 RepID=UPI0037F76BF5